ncbi:DNA-O6-methylguanine--protein-cysteine S-methyltransferase /Transcriptional regulator Ada [Desulfuromusa kysingii]|uniref:methylated-DNA--[protein]-cysteine S-methyltransferase n=1 Tax=Desulfuromusa kysingii TaxID=37625 RepID=A0A1H3XMN8_9BACT|nr:methylated-DNA--[protein]-cysteine S-methyltransferase [Desulfuromusa kysingii]SEA00606.1 DNA-O6-methylguanine--protein-cysteine S-methyltransferase /Transcriptional regulator Ada [Desulfuromusa kysingii]
MPDDYQRIAQAIHYLKGSAHNQPSLDEVAAQLGLSPYHFQRLFRRFAGVSPKRFLQHLTTEHAKKVLLQSTSVLDATFTVGLSSPSRLHDLLVSVEAVTPGEYQSHGINLQISYAVHPSPFGSCFIAVTERGICRLEFIDETETEAMTQRLRQSWPHALISENSVKTEKIVKTIFTPPHSPTNKSLLLLLQGTNFQLKVWQALLKIPPGAVTSYGALAKMIGKPQASRAIGTAIGNNPIGYLIPCHRVLRSDGGIGGYRWGIERKRIMLGKELCEGHSESNFSI